MLAEALSFVQVECRHYAFMWRLRSSWLSLQNAENFWW